jgi:hypothetical protein
VAAQQSGSVTIHAEPGRSVDVELPGPPLAHVAGVRLAVVFWGGLALVDVGRLVAAPSYAELGALALLVAASSIGMRTRTALSAAVVGWLVMDGFIEHSVGVLGFDGTRDTARLALLTALAMTASRVRR